MKKTVIFLFFISIFLLSFFPVKDTDFGWHYRCGKEFLTFSNLCLKNNFSYFLFDYKSYYPGHFYDIFLTFIYDRFGFIGLSLIGSIIFTLVAFIWLKLLKTDLWIKITSFYGIFFLSANVFSLGFRSQLITYLFFLLLLLILEKSEKNKNYLFTLPPLFFLWVNSHIGFFIGLIVLGFFVFHHFLRSPLKMKWLLFVFLLSFFATLMNPFGVNVYQEILNHASSPLNKMIAEWVEPPFWQSILIIASTLTGLSAILRQKYKFIFNILLILFFSFLALKVRRNLPFFYTSFFYVFLNNLSLKFNFSKKLNEITVPILTSLIILVAIIHIPKTIRFDTSWNEYCYKGLSVLPCQALKKYPQLSGNVYAMYEWGGFLIWQKPKIKIFVDGRMPAWKDENGKSPYQVFLDIIQTQPGWNEKLNRWKTNYLLITNGTFLDLLLQKEAGKYHWRQMYRDEVAVVYKNIGR